MSRYQRKMTAIASRGQCKLTARVLRHSIDYVFTVMCHRLIRYHAPYPNLRVRTPYFCGQISVANKQYMAFSLSDKTIRVFRNDQSTMAQVNTVIFTISVPWYPLEAFARIFLSFMYHLTLQLKGHRDTIQSIRFLHSGEHLLLSADRSVQTSDDKE